MKCITSKHLKYLKNTLENKHEFSYEHLYFKPTFRTRRYRSKYATLQQGTSFFRNLVDIIETLFNCESEEEWHIKLDLKRIPQEVADFVIAYVWLCPGRWFNYDWRFLNGECKDPVPAFSSKLESDAWHIVNDRFKKIARDHLPICSVDDFINYEICA